jgi:hypothetical protein
MPLLALTGVRLGALLLWLASGPLAGQQREVLSKEISVGRSEASLVLELTGGETLEVAIDGGTVRVDGEELGTASPELDTAWRSLLGQLVTLEDGPLVQTLRDWSPPEALAGEALDLANRVDRALEDALDSAVTAADPAAEARPDMTLSALLRSGSRLAQLSDALDGLDLDDVNVHVDEDVDVAAGEEIEGTVVVVDGDLTVSGEVDGDVVLVGGSLRLREGGRVSGDVRLLDALLMRDGGRVEGEVIQVEGRERRDVDEDTQEQIRQELLSELRAELDEDRDRSGVSALLSPVRFVVRGVAGVVGSLLTVVVLSLVGGVIVHLAHGNLEVAAETARRAPGRAAAVGLAGTFLALPVWILGALVLIISLIGIPVALIWLPVFPLAFALAVVLGYYAVARNVGAWIARQHYSHLGWVRSSNPFTLVAGGVLGLCAAFVAASVLQLAGPWLGVLRGLFIMTGVLITVFASLVGFGAVLITRAGRRPEYAGSSAIFDEGWDSDFGTPAPETPASDAERRASEETF